MTDKYINVYAPPELELFNVYLNNNSYIKTIKNQNETDYLLQVTDKDLVTLPKMGMVVKGNSIPLSLKDFKIELTYKFNNDTYFFIRRKYITPIYDDLSIVLQGVIINSTIDFLCILFMYGRLILSTWDKYDFPTVKANLEEQKIFNNQNIYYQVYTTIRGLYEVKTKYVLKVRSDEIYSDLKDLIDEIFINPDKIITTNIFIRRVNHFSYHCSDHLIGGLTKNIIKMFNGAELLINNNTVKTKHLTNIIWVPEQVLTFGYFINLYPFKSIKIERCSYLMNKHFKSVHLQKFKKFKVMYSRHSYKGFCRKIEVNNLNFHIHRKTIIDLDSFENLYDKEPEKIKI
jgi:hypothetical protein